MAVTKRQKEKPSFNFDEEVDVSSALFPPLRLTVTVGEVHEAAGAGVAVLSRVVWFAEAATGQILAGSVRKL